MFAASSPKTAWPTWWCSPPCPARPTRWWKSPTTSTKKNPEGANNVINQLERKYIEHANELYATEEYKQKTLEFLKEEFDYLRSFTKILFTSFEEKVILAQGEIISTNMVTNYLKECGVKTILFSALDFMRTDKNSEPDFNYIKEKINELLDANPGYQIYITQGFICRNAYGEVDNLLRGGSDYTACLIGAAIKSEEIQIWTDIDGMHNNDPRVVEHTKPVRLLHFEEAAELAYFGAKILHPTCIQPAKFAGVPVRLLNTMDPTAPGTIINNELQKGRNQGRGRQRPHHIHPDSRPAACCWPTVSCAKCLKSSKATRRASTW